MLPLILLLQATAATARPDVHAAQPHDSAMRAVLDSAAHRNLALPVGLRAYHAELESEIAVVLRSSTEHENALQLEQIESALDWSRETAFEQHIVGYRARAATASLSALSYFHGPWVAPVQYGNRLQFLLSRKGTGAREDPRALHAVHPLATDRDDFYKYAGGDTVEVLQTHDRTIPVVRIEVSPKINHSTPLLLFRGELDVDVTRYQIVRMRGELIRINATHSLRSRLTHLVLQGITYIELENGEFLGKFWLPTYQRIEAQARSPVASELRPLFRVVTRFRAHRITEDSAAAPAARQLPNDEVSVPEGGALTSARRDSLGAFADWKKEIGAETVAARASDFDDIAPDAWRVRGKPRLDWHAEHVADVLRFNRIEGLYTGAAATMHFRDRVPGLSLGGYGGVAWNEETVRGTLFARRVTSHSRWQGEVGRSLMSTNDFRPALDFEASLMAALVTADDYDYFDRQHARVSVSRALGSWASGSITLESGAISDNAVTPHVAYGLIHADSGFRSNRAIDPGRAWRNAISVSVNPGVSGELLEPGVGVVLSYERGDGSLYWQRVDGRIVARHTWRSLTYAARVDGSAAFGTPVPRQQLLEFGENEGLPGYLYKEFGGDRAALVRGNVAYSLPLLQAPIRLRRNVVLPSLAPAVAFAIQSGWADASASTLRQLGTFGVRRDSTTGLPVIDKHTRLPMLATRPTYGVRTSIEWSLRFFGGAMAIGIARAIDTKSPWRLTFAAAQGL